MNTNDVYITSKKKWSWGASALFMVILSILGNVALYLLMDEIIQLFCR